jgi:hypothetical protein
MENNGKSRITFLELSPKATAMPKQIAANFRNIRVSQFAELKKRIAKIRNHSLQSSFKKSCGR